MPKFNKELDNEIYSEAIKFDKSKITVAVFSYNEGSAKLQLTRQNKNADGEWSFTKLGRLSKDELEGILPLIDKAKEHL